MCLFSYPALSIGISSLRTRRALLELRKSFELGVLHRFKSEDAACTISDLELCR